MARKPPPKAKKKAPEELKRCARCKNPKPRSAFGPNAALADGLSAYCRECKSKNQPAKDFKRAGELAKGIVAAVSQAPEKSDRPAPPFGPPLSPGSKISVEVIEAICEVLRKGHTRTAAARHAGIHEDLLAQWMHRGRDAKPGEPTKLVFDAVIAAEGEAEIALVEQISVESQFDPRLKFKLLERRFPEWARKDQLTLKDERANPQEHADLLGKVREKLLKLAQGLVPAAPPAPEKAAGGTGDGGS